MSSIFGPRPDEEWLSILNRVYIWAGGIAALSGVIALLATKGIQIYSERVASVQGQKVAQAVSDTAQANERASKLEVTAEQARAEQKRLETKIEEQKGENLRLQSKVEQEYIERLKLQARTEPRHLRPEQSAKLTELLRASKHHGEFHVFVYIGTDDGTPLSLELINAINDAPGWVARHQGQNTAGGQITGIALLVKDLRTTPRYVVDLHEALKAIGINAPYGNISQAIGGDPDPPVPIIFIAPRP